LEVSALCALSAAHLAVLDEPTAVRARRTVGTDRTAPVEQSLLMNIMPILSRRRSAGIRHSIAQFCQVQGDGLPPLSPETAALAAFLRGG
jgi:hypothetical protein